MGIRFFLFCFLNQMLFLSCDINNIYAAKDRLGNGMCSVGFFQIFQGKLFTWYLQKCFTKVEIIKFMRSSYHLINHLKHHHHHDSVFEQYEDYLYGFNHLLTWSKPQRRGACYVCNVHVMFNFCLRPLLCCLGVIANIVKGLKIIN